MPLEPARYHDDLMQGTLVLPYQHRTDLQTPDRLRASLGQPIEQFAVAGVKAPEALLLEAVGNHARQHVAGQHRWRAPLESPPPERPHRIHIHGCDTVEFDRQICGSRR
jgi:hypothetical protein